MNDNNSREDHVWESLLAKSSPTFAGETVAPFGFATRMLANIRDQQAQEAVWLRIGSRAIFASFAMVVIMTIVTVVDVRNDDVEAPVKNLALVANVQVT